MIIAASQVHQEWRIGDAAARQIRQGAGVVEFGPDVVGTGRSGVVIHDGIIEPSPSATSHAAAAVGGVVQDHGAIGDHPTINAATVPGSVVDDEAVVERRGVNAATGHGGVGDDEAIDCRPAINAATTPGGVIADGAIVQSHSISTAAGDGGIACERAVGKDTCTIEDGAIRRTTGGSDVAGECATDQRAGSHAATRLRGIFPDLTVNEGDAISAAAG